VINLEGSIKLNSSWGHSFWDNSTKTFLFKLHNNQLGTNARVAHFVRGHEKNCTFCSLSNDEDDNPESILHLFYECRHVENLLTEFFSFLFQSPNRGVSKTEFFVGFNREMKMENEVLDTITIIVKKFIWDCRLRFRVPSNAELNYCVLCNLARIIKHSRTFSLKFHNIAFLANHHYFRF